MRLNCWCRWICCNNISLSVHVWYKFLISACIYEEYVVRESLKTFRKKILKRWKISYFKNPSRIREKIHRKSLVDFLFVYWMYERFFSHFQSSNTNAERKVQSSTEILRFDGCKKWQATNHSIHRKFVYIF